MDQRGVFPPGVGNGAWMPALGIAALCFASPVVLAWAFLFLVRRVPYERMIPPIVRRALLRLLLAPINKLRAWVDAPLARATPRQRHHQGPAAARVADTRTIANDADCYGHDFSCGAFPPGL